MLGESSPVVARKAELRRCVNGSGAVPKMSSDLGEAPGGRGGATGFLPAAPGKAGGGGRPFSVPGVGAPEVVDDEVPFVAKGSDGIPGLLAFAYGPDWGAADEMVFGIGGGGPVFFAAPVWPFEAEEVIVIGFGMAGGVFLATATGLGGPANPRGFCGNAGGSVSPFAISFVATTVALGRDSARRPLEAGSIVIRC